MTEHNDQPAGLAPLGTYELIWRNKHLTAEAETVGDMIGQSLEVLTVAAETSGVLTDELIEAHLPRPTVPVVKPLAAVCHPAG